MLFSFSFVSFIGLISGFCDIRELSLMIERVPYDMELVFLFLLVLFHFIFIFLFFLMHC